MWLELNFRLLENKNLIFASDIFFFMLRYALLICFILLSGMPAVKAQDTLFFRDGTYSVGRVEDVQFRKITFMQFGESGDSIRRTEKASRLDSVFFKQGLVFRKGFSEDTNLLPNQWKRFASFWDGRRFGEKKTDFTKSFMASSYLSGLVVLGLPYTLYRSARNPELQELPTREAYRFRGDKDFAKGYRNGVKRTHFNATIPMYSAGLITTLLILALIIPH
jgi:hypothetical protein